MKSLFSLSLILLLAACGNFLPAREINYNLRYEILDLEFEPNNESFHEGHEHHLKEFITRIDPHTIKNIVFIPHENYEVGQVAENSIANRFHRLGYEKPIEKQKTTCVPYGQLSVHVRFLSLAFPPECPNWSSRSSYSDRGNRQFSHIGCATAQNFSVMLMHLEDLADGYSDLSPDAENSGLAIEAYRTGEI
jgi:type IV pilus biogenesis protein CpaD/CtpE